MATYSPSSGIPVPVTRHPTHDCVLRLECMDRERIKVICLEGFPHRTSVLFCVSREDSPGGWYFLHACREDFNPDFHATHTHYPRKSISRYTMLQLFATKCRHGYFRVSSFAISEVRRQFARRTPPDVGQGRNRSLMAGKRTSDIQTIYHHWV